jgi:hypothetical protein
MRPSPYSHAIAKVQAHRPAAVTPTPMSSRDASHGFSRSLCARVAGAVAKSRRAGRDKSHNHLWGIVPVARRLSRLDAWDARLLRCYARRNEVGRQSVSRPAQRRRDDRLLSVAASPVSPVRCGRQIADLRLYESCWAAPGIAPNNGLRLPRAGPFL